MPSPSVTYTFANSTTADASQVNQNFTDVINGMTDGSKDLSVSAITLAGTLTANGNINLGNSSGDDLTITASLASTLSIKTNNSYNIGSATLGLAGVYLGSAGGLTTRIIGGATGSSWTLTLPTTAGTSRYRLETDGAGVSSWQPVRRSPTDAQNYSLATSVNANALTITLNGADGNAPSSTNPVDIVFRNATAATGTPVTRSITGGALTLTISSTSTMGFVGGSVTQYLYIYAIDNAGTVELAASHSNIFDSGTVVTTTAEGGAGAADSGITLYSTTARANVACRLLGRIKFTLATAGTWDEAGDEIALPPFSDKHLRSYASFDAHAGYGATATKIPYFTNSSTTTVGTAMTVTSNDGTNGLAITINEDGIYAITFICGCPSGAATGIACVSLNATVTTNASALAAANKLAYHQATLAAGCTQDSDCSFIGFLAAGSIVRPHTNGAVPATAANSQFFISRVGY